MTSGGYNRVATNLEYSGISLNMENLGNSVQPQGKTVISVVSLSSVVIQIFV